MKYSEHVDAVERTTAILNDFPVDPAEAAAAINKLREILHAEDK